MRSVRTDGVVRPRSKLADHAFDSSARCATCWIDRPARWRSRPHGLAETTVPLVGERHRRGRGGAHDAGLGPSLGMCEHAASIAILSPTTARATQPRIDIEF